MRLSHISHVAAFSRISAKCAYRIFFPHKLASSTAILILSVFLLPISFLYLDHLVANRMAPSMCPDSGPVCLCGTPYGTRWSSWFPAVMYHISAYFCRIFGVCAIRIFLIKMPHMISRVFENVIWSTLQFISLT